jgi:glycosyltransferase involved in cell wall biosynthesis
MAATSRHLGQANRRRGGLIFVTQLLDPTDPVLGFVPGLLPSLAAHAQKLLVIANEVRAVPAGLDIEIESLGKEHGRGRAARILRYERLLARLGRDQSFGGLFAHMCPAYASLAAPPLRPRGKRVALWFAHPRDSRQLAVAERLSTVVLTSLPDAYPRRTHKAVAIGQAIDTDQWRFVPPRKPGPTLKVIALGRTSPGKGYSLMVEAVKRARERGLPVDLRIVGPATTPAEIRHRDELVRLIGALEMDDHVELVNGVSPEALRQLVPEADVLLNASRPGYGDKVIFEAMASGRLVVVSNPAFASVLRDLPVDLLFPDKNVNALVDRLYAFAQLPLREREAIGRELRKRVVTGHSVSGWAESVVREVTGMSACANEGPRR